MQSQDLVKIMEFHEKLIFMISGSRIIKKALCFKGFLQPGRGGPQSRENPNGNIEISWFSWIPSWKLGNFMKILEIREITLSKTYALRNGFPYFFYSSTAWLIVAQGKYNHDLGDRGIPWSLATFRYFS